MCETDDDCKINAAGTCIEGHCFLMQPAGAYCTKGHECASYFYYGPRACTTDCSPVSKCQLMLKNSSLNEGFMCCRSIPMGKGCKSKDSLYSANNQHHGGCDKRSVCANEFGHYRCLPKEPGWWKFLLCLVILASVVLNFAYVLKRLQVASTPTPGRSLGIFWISSAGSLALLVCYLLGPLTFVAPLTNSGLLVRLWLCIVRGRISIKLFTDVVLSINLVIGLIFTTAYGQKYEKRFNACEVVALLFQPHFARWVKIMTIVLIVLYVTMKFIEANTIMRPSRYLQGQPVERMTMLTQKPLITPYDALFRVNWSFTYPDSIWNIFILPLCYGYLVAYFSAGTVIACKMIYRIIATYDEMDPFLSTYKRDLLLAFTAAVVLATLQFYWTLKSFRRISGRLIEVLITVFSVLLVCVVGWLLFEELDNFDGKTTLYYVLAVTAILLSAVGIILRREEL